MSTDQIVQTTDVRDALDLLQRHGRGRVLQQLVEIEPDLAEHVLEELCRLDRGLLKADLDAKQARQLYEQSEALVLVSLLALRRGLVRLWHDQFAGHRLAQIDPSRNETDESGGQVPPTREEGI